MTSMIQAYVDIARRRAQATASQPQVIPAVRNQDDFRTHVKAYKPLGKLIRPDFIDIRGGVKKDINAIRYFIKGVQGEGNDYSTGRINDIGIKLGSLGIAGVLATTKGSPLTKGMEFVGAACWFAAMSLWPKLAIHTPIKMAKGVDLSLEYEPYPGHNKEKDVLAVRRKNFFEDPQYICWDLISDEEIYKMGDKMGIPKNIKNRRKAIENKARQIAIQGNTLALLTAGFATPLVASLAADTLSRKAVSPLLEKLQESKADKLKQQLIGTASTPIKNQADIEFIEKALSDKLTDNSRQEITNYFTNKLGLEGDKKAITKTINAIFDASNNSNATIKLNDQLAEKLADTVIQNVSSERAKKLSRDNLIEAFKNVAQNYGENVSEATKTATGTTLSDYIYDTKDVLNELSGKLNKDLPKVEEAITKVFDDAKMVNVASPDATKKQLQKVAELINTYSQRAEKDLDKLSRNALRYDSSSNARVWENASEEVLKAFNFSYGEIKKMQSREDNKLVQRLLSQKTNNLLSDDALFEKAIERLGKVAQNTSTKTNKHVDFMLDYVDTLQKTLNSEPHSSVVKGLSHHLNINLANERKDILSRYLSANGTMFAPIRGLNALKKASNMPEINQDILKTLVLNSQTVDNFINKLEALKDKITTQAEFNKYVDVIFGPLDDNVAKMLPDGLAKEINQNAELLKAMLTNLSDGVNRKFCTQMNQEEILSAIRNSKLEKYLDEYFDVSFRIRDDKNLEEMAYKNKLLNTITDKVRESRSKIDELKTFLRLDDITPETSIDDAVNIIKRELTGDGTLHRGFLENGQNRIKNLLDFLGNDSKELLFERLDIYRAKTIKTSSVTPLSMTDFIKDSVLKVAPHKTWVRRIGIAFAALCGITAIALTQIGQTNKFNPDIYHKRNNN